MNHMNSLSCVFFKLVLAFWNPYFLCSIFLSSVNMSFFAFWSSSCIRLKPSLSCSRFYQVSEMFFWRSLILDFYKRLEKLFWLSSTIFSSKEDPKETVPGFGAPSISSFFMLRLAMDL